MNSFYRRWIVANAWSESLGLGTTFVIGSVVAPFVDNLASGTRIVATVVGAVAIGVAFEGLLVGFAQEQALRRAIPRLPRLVWIYATAIGAGVAWVVGMIPSMVIGLAAEGRAEPNPLLPRQVEYFLAALMGGVTGPVLGLAQWFVIRRHMHRAHRWLWANALAWAAGMPLIFAGMDLVPWTGSRLAVTAAIYLVCAVTGAAVGAIHGSFLRSLLSTVQPAQDLPNQHAA